MTYFNFGKQLEAVFVAYHCSMMLYLIQMLEKQKEACSPIAYLRWCCNGGRTALRMKAEKLMLQSLKMLEQLQDNLRTKLTELTTLPILVAFDDAQVLQKHFPFQKTCVPWSEI